MRFRTLSRVTLVATLGLAACSTDQVTAPTPLRPSLAISDAVHDNGNAHFYFLPPMVARPTTAGVFDATVQPSLTICSLAAATEAEVTPASACDGRYALTVPYGTSGHAVVRVHVPHDNDCDDEDDDDAARGGHYHYKWAVPVSPVTFYRITIRAGALNLGFADVETATNNRDLKNVQTQEFIPRKDGVNLHIKFRVEQGALSGWNTLRAMPTSRQWVSVTSDGQRLFALGGWNGGNLATNEAYSAATDTWATLAPMPSARYAGTGAQLIGSKLYLAGGSDGYPSMSNSLFVYDIVANTWATELPAPRPMGCGASATVGGRLFVFAGCTNSFTYDSSMAVFDPGTHVWRQLLAAPHIHLYPSAVAVGTRVYVISGINSESNSLTGAVDIFDTVTETWSAGPPIPTARYSTSAVLLNGRIYVFGGTTAPGGAALGVVEVLDTSTQSWATSASMLTARWDAGAAIVGGRMAIVGGTPTGLSWFGVAEAYHP